MAMQSVLMIGSALVGGRTRQRPAPYLILSLGLLACATALPASAADCPGHPEALGTSRTLVVDPREHPRIGTMQYPETLPLADHEVVLTFDDGPLPRNSNQILEILASQCVKATFFEIGRMAQAFPEGVRKLRDAGHSIGTHSQDHPLTMDRMSIERAKQQIDDGIASVTAALGDPAALAPFFRIPGLMRAEGVEDYLASQGIQVWSADFLADDWRHISSSRVYDLAIKRLEEKGKGILLLHDIQPRTVAALPRILHELKARGYSIVHVVPATPELPATPTEPQQWQLHPPEENVATSHWSKIPNFIYAETEALPAPALSDLEVGQPATLAESSRHQGHLVPLPREAPWPRQMAFEPDNNSIVLPIPAQTVFEIRDRPSVPRQASRRPDQAVASADEMEGPAKLVSVKKSRHAALSKSHARHARRGGASHVAHRGGRQPAHAHRGPLKHLVQVKKRNV
jgi:peptidoglycan-N-acetylglucosamine deacetylase